MLKNCCPVCPFNYDCLICLCSENFIKKIILVISSVSNMSSFQHQKVARIFIFDYFGWESRVHFPINERILGDCDLLNIICMHDMIFKNSKLECSFLDTPQLAYIGSVFLLCFKSTKWAINAATMSEKRNTISNMENRLAPRQRPRDPPIRAIKSR